jgi:lipoprotein NlpI
LHASRAAAQTQQQIDWCNNNGNAFSVDQRIGGCTALVESGRASVQNRAAGYSNRCWAYSDKGDADRALIDCNQAIRLDPKFALAYYNRGDAYRNKGDVGSAIADYNQAIQLDPKFFQTYLARGLLSLDAGELPKALADINQASALSPKDPYTALWLDIVKKRSKLPSRLAEATAQIDMTKWPAPVIRLYLGQMTPQAVLAAAADLDASKQKSQVCEANFFSGELALQQGRKDEATRLLRIAAEGCPKDSFQLTAANAELKALGAQP